MSFSFTLFSGGRPSRSGKNLLESRLTETMSKTEPSDLASDESRTSSPTPEPKKLYTEYEDKTQEVKRQFVVLEENQYINRLKKVFSAANEFMTCDCTEELENGVNFACGPESDCINRLTNIECVNGQCGCGDSCRNQRFQRREYADVSIFLTRDKGYGMRANVDIPANTFVIEYMGEIVDNEEYKVRKQNYDSEGIKHFYFMMIQDNEIIDATKMASLGRYCNHSCDPNAYVDKWVVNKRFRMGIFSKKRISKGEEICFDYNVDRYGAEPQKCYCGAANCLGVMGGKTQSESVRLLPHIITEALGVRASDEKKWIKEQKKNGVKITNDNIDSNVNVEFVKSLELSPLNVSDVARISSCLMQPDLDTIVINRILERLLLSKDDELKELLVRFNRLHGIQALGNALKTTIENSGNKALDAEHKKTVNDIVFLFEHWPSLKSKNALQDSEVEKFFGELENKNLSSDIQERIFRLMEQWSTLEIVYRIPKKQENEPNQVVINERRNRLNGLSDTSIKATKLPTGPALSKPWGELDVASLHENRKLDGVPLPSGWEWALDPSSGKRYYFNRSLGTTQWIKPEWSVVENEEEEKRRRKERDREREKNKELRDLKILEKERALEKRTEMKKQEERLNMLSTIIAEASRSESPDLTSSKRSKIPTKPKRSVTINRPASSSSKSHKLKDGNVENSTQKAWTKLFAAYVPNAIKKYESSIGRDNLKNCARDIVHLLTDKESKRHAGESVPSALSEERKFKVKSFCKSYMTKFLEKYESKKRRSDHPEGHSKKTKV